MSESLKRSLSGVLRKGNVRGFHEMDWIHHGCKYVDQSRCVGIRRCWWKEMGKGKGLKKGLAGNEAVFSIIMSD